MSEIELQRKLKKMLKSETREWQEIPIMTASPNPLRLKELIQQNEFSVKEEELLLPSSKLGLSQDLFALQRPDLAVVSRASAQTRILIEVKQATSSTHKELDASQFVRNLLFLLSATDRHPRGNADIRRAVLVAAPQEWFGNKVLSREWDYLVGQYTSLAQTFDITLGAIYLDA
jgi:hypothetical protein